MYKNVRGKPRQSVLPSKGVVALWHDELLAVTNCFSGTNAHFMISPSKDGRLLSTLLEKWGFRFIWGSPFKDGKQALSDAIEKCSDAPVLITVDGSRGPNHVMKAGAVVAAMRSGEPLYLCRAYGKGIRLRSWDRFQIVFPFSKIDLVLSDPIYVSANASREEIDTLIANCQNQLESL